MRIYAVADIHARPERMERIRANILAEQPDVLVIAGDIGSFRKPARVLSELNAMPVPVLAVRGNTDLKRVERLIDLYDNIQSLHLNRVRMAGIDFVGISGTVPVPFRSRLGFREKQVVRKALDLLDTRTVFVVHPPPFGALDQVMGKYPAGSRAVSALIARKQPRLVLCGHIHEAFGFVRMGGSWIVNCNMAGGRQGAVVDMTAEGTPKIEMRGAAGAR